MRIAPITRFDNVKCGFATQATVAPCLPDKKPCGAQNLPHPLNYAPKIFFSGNPQSKFMTGKHNELTIDKNVILEGDAMIDSIVIKGDDTEVRLGSGLSVGEVTHKPSGKGKDYSFLKVGGAQVGLI